MNNKYDILFKHQVPNSMDGIIIFGKEDKYLKPQQYNKITNLENEALFYNKERFEQGGIIIASNNYLTHARICLEIKNLIKKYDLYPL